MTILDTHCNLGAPFFDWQGERSSKCALLCKAICRRGESVLYAIGQQAPKCRGTSSSRFAHSPFDVVNGVSSLSLELSLLHTGVACCGGVGVVVCNKQKSSL